MSSIFPLVFEMSWMMEQKKSTAPRTKDAEDKKSPRAQRKVKTIKDTATAVYLHNEKSLQFRSQIVICCN